ncbi:MAG: hypothetical protein MUD14_18995 [Hydrococcus sp. Prado102]|nr:hypothetical protein [Hydrococcus sp. Prado102]
MRSNTDKIAIAIAISVTSYQKSKVESRKSKVGSKYSPFPQSPVTNHHSPVTDKGVK